jgi:hypothetical protein
LIYWEVANSSGYETASSSYCIACVQVTTTNSNDLIVSANIWGTYSGYYVPFVQIGPNYVDGSGNNWSVASASVNTTNTFTAANGYPYSEGGGMMSYKSIASSTFGSIR